MPSSFRQPLITVLQSAPTTLTFPDYLRALTAAPDLRLGFGLHLPSIAPLQTLGADRLTLVNFQDSRGHVFPRAAHVPVWADGIYCEIPAMHLEPGMRIPQIVICDFPTVMDRLTLPQVIVDAAAEDGLRLRNPLPLTAAFGRTSGRLYGDGWADQDHVQNSHIYLANSRNCVGEAFYADLWDAMLEPDSPRPRFCDIRRESTFRPEVGRGDYPSNGSIQRTVRSRALARFFGSLIGRGANLKSLPDWVVFATREFRIGLIDGLLDTDGSVAIVNRHDPDPHDARDWNVSITTTSPQGAVGIVQLLASDGLIASITESPQRPRNGKPSDNAIRHMINIWHGTIARRITRGVSNVERRARFEWIQSYREEPRLRVPAMPDLYDALRVSAEEIGIHRSSLRNSTHIHGAIDRANALRILAEMTERVRNGVALVRGWENDVMDSRLRWHTISEVVADVPRTYPTILHTRREGPDHMGQIPVTLPWPQGPDLFVARDGFVARGLSL